MLVGFVFVKLPAWQSDCDLLCATSLFSKVASLFRKVYGVFSLSPCTVFKMQLCHPGSVIWRVFDGLFDALESVEVGGATGMSSGLLPS